MVVSVSEEGGFTEEEKQKWIGRKVAFLGGGWSTYVVKDKQYLVPYDDNPAEFKFEQAAMTYVNPFTVTAMYDFALKAKAQSVILMAASSALCKMMIKLCHAKGLKSISLVRSEENVQDLKANYPTDYVLNQSSPTFLDEL